MKRITFLLGLFTLVSSTFTFAQTEKSVPESASFTICFDGKNIQNKMSLSQFEKLDIIKEFKEEIARKDSKLPTLKKMGFDFSKKTYFSIDRNDTATAYIFSIPLASNKWMIKELSKDEGNVKIKNSKYTVFRDYRNAIIVSKNQLLLVDYDIDYRFDNDYTEEAREEGGAIPVYKNEKGEEISKWEWRSIQKFKHTLSYALERMAGKDANKKMNRKSTAVAYAWFNGNFINKLNPRRSFYRPEDLFINQAQNELYDKFGSTEMFLELNIDKNGGDLSIESVMNDKLKSMYSNVYNKSIDENLLKYIPQDAIGYTSYAINAKGMYEEYKNFFASYKSSNKDIQLARDIWDLVDLVLDEDAIFETIKGDAVLAFNGVEEVEFTKRKWEYNEETFKETMVEVKAKEKLPVFTAAFSIGNKEMYEKVFRIISRNEKDFEKREDGSWIAKDRSFQSYFYLTEKALIITNGTNFDLTKAKNGFRKSMISRKEEFQNTPITMYFNFTELMKEIPQEELRMSEKELLNAAQKYQSDIKLMPAGFEGNTWKTKIRINTNGPKGTNGLQHFMNFVNDMYKVEEKRREERRKRWEKEEKAAQPVEKDTEGAVEEVIEDAGE